MEHDVKIVKKAYTVIDKNVKLNVEEGKRKLKVLSEKRK